MMEVKISLYGNLINLAGGRTRVVQVEGNPPTVAHLRTAVARQIPEVAPHLKHTAVGVGADLFPDDAVLPHDQEISLLPPVSGG